MRHFSVLVITLLTALLIVFMSLAKETSGTLDFTSIQAAYKDSSSAYFLFDRNSSFYSNYELTVESPYLLTRKIGHFIAYGILASLLFLCIPYKSVIVRAVVAASSASFIGFIDEYHQHFLESRSGRLLDVIINSAGSISFIAMLLVLFGLLSLRRRFINAIENKLRDKKIS